MLVHVAAYLHNTTSSSSFSSFSSFFLSLFSFKGIPEIVDKLNLLPQLNTVERRRRLGTQLGIPKNELNRIGALQKEAALEKMVDYAFKRHLLIRLPNALGKLGGDPAPPQEVDAIRDLVAWITGIDSTLVLFFVCVCVCVCVCVDS